jgi:hypothetical protein
VSPPAGRDLSDTMATTTTACGKLRGGPREVGILLAIRARTDLRAGRGHLFVGTRAFSFCAIKVRIEPLPFWYAGSDRNSRASMEIAVVVARAIRIFAIAAKSNRRKGQAEGASANAYHGSAVSTVAQLGLRDEAQELLAKASPKLGHAATTIARGSSHRCSARPQTARAARPVNHMRCRMDIHLLDS